HMLSTGAFNALLKTLEEPPSHVKFVLATTEAHKIPATIVSRCQRFDFRAIDAITIAAQLTKIMLSEGIEAEEAVLKRVSRLANGSMRDALSLLDKLLSYEPQRLTLATVQEILPPPHDELAQAVIDRVAERDSAGALLALDHALQTGRTVERFCDHLIEHVRTLMVLRICGPETDLVDIAESAKNALLAQAQKFDAATYVYMIALLEELRRSAKYSSSHRALADAAIVRLSMSQQFSDIQTMLSTLEGRPDKPLSPPPSARPANVKNETAPARTPLPTAPKTTSGGSEKKVPLQEKLSSTVRERVLRDPLVQKVRQSVEGTVVEIRSPNPSPKAPELETPSPEATEESLFN
ncbi:MAG: hypothetical protein AABZ47_17540, partial [Planctomycetota bacterium]